MAPDNTVSEFSIVAYKPCMAREINELWRLSFDLALGLEKRSDRDSFDDQLKFLRHQLANQTSIMVALDSRSSKIAGFMALSKAEVEQLYIHPAYQHKGLGRQFINIAKDRSDGELSLFTFQLNKHAQCFYEAMGFVEVERACADMESNPWAEVDSQLKDIKYHWSLKL